MIKHTLLAGIGSFSAVVLTAVAGWTLRSRVTDARQTNRVEPVTQVGAGEAGEFIDFPAKSFATHPGKLSLTPPSGRGSLVLGPAELHSSVVRRPVLTGETATVRRERRGRLSGHLGETPEAFGLRYECLEIGKQQLWKVEGQETGRDVWVIHVHGLGSQRSQTLRGVETFASLGFTSLVPTYRTSLDAGADAVPRSNLGVTEWWEIARVQEYALAAGAKKIIYVGWSLGASIVLRTVQQVPRSEVSGALLVSPALDWRAIILAGMAANRVPRWLAEWAFSGFNLIRRSGEPFMPWSSFPGTSSAQTPPLPVLVFHGTEDHSVPIRLSRDMAHRRAGPVRLVEFPGAHHTLEWNSNPDLWEHEIRSWCAGLNLLSDTDTLTNNLETA